MAVDLTFNADRTRASIVFAHLPGNLLTAEVVGKLRGAIAATMGQHHLKLLTIEGAGPDFSFGASIPEHALDRIGPVLTDTHALLYDVIAAPVVTAAIVRGRCLGGGFELALACDFIFAEDTAVFGLPEIAIGVFPPAGAVLLPKRVGAARATSTVLTGASRSAVEWSADGLIEHVSPAAELVDLVNEWFARTLAPRSAEALRHAVRAARHSLAEDVGRELPAVEQLYLKELMRSHDASEGIQAFLDKRAPRWKDR